MKSTCKNCGHITNEAFCAHCGLSTHIHRIDWHYFKHELLHLLHLEKGFFYTAKNLMINPGPSIREFLYDDRRKHMKPIAYLIITSLLFSILAHLFHVDFFYNAKEQMVFGDSYVGKFLHWTKTNYGYANILSGFFYAISVTLFFKKSGVNFFESTVMLCYILGETMLLLSVEILLYPLLNSLGFIVGMTIISFAYPTFAIGHFFNKSSLGAYVKAFIAFFLGYLLFNLMMVGAGLLADQLFH